MLKISHRGNLIGPNPNLENRFDYIIEAIKKGFDVEIDLRFYDKSWWLGHDFPQYQIEISELLKISERLWCHCKNFESLEKIQDYNLNYFWHQNDDHTLTSKGFIWTYPGKEIGNRNIVVMPETVMSINDIKTIKAFGICSDFIEKL